MQAPGVQVAICEDDVAYQRSLILTLQTEFNTVVAPSVSAILELLTENPPQLILLDIGLGNGRDGFSLLPRLQVLAPHVPVVIHSGLADYGTAVEAMRLGAVDFVPKGCSPDEVRNAVRQALQVRQPGGAAPSTSPSGLVVASPVMCTIERLATRLRAFSGNVIITGESGVGKEGIARMLQGERADGTPEPFVTVDASTIHSTTAESTLFGHERGAFTGADSARPGLFEQAHNGVIYFDEVANMSLDIQAKLLRVLQEGEVRRLGSSRTNQLRFRVVCATNCNLEALSQAGEFRFDLYTRLSVFPIHIPPLRERPEDILPLIRHFVATLEGPPRRGFTDDAQELMQDYGWPGNVRELRNAVEYALAMAEGKPVRPQHLPEKIREQRPALPCPSPDPERDRRSLRERLYAFEQTVLAEEYRRAERNISEMAMNLKVDRSALHAKLTAMGIHTPTPRRGNRHDAP